MKILSLYEYPLKGARGRDLCCAPVGLRGLAHDRRWMLVDERGQFLSQRQLPALARWQAEPRDEGLLLMAPGQQRVVEADCLCYPLTVTVWGQQVTVHGGCRPADAWLSGLLGRPVRLVYMVEKDIRPLTGRGSRPGDTVSLADGYPVLLTTRASLKALRERLPEAVPMNRFRPNLVADGMRPFEEDNWQKIRVGEVVFRVAKRCARCQVVNIDQDTGIAGREPLRTLSKFRKEGNKVYFGVNLIPENTGLIHRHDTVEILA